MAKRPRRDSADSELSVPILTHQEAPGRRSSSMTPAAKISSSSTEQPRAMTMHCSLPPHRETVQFASYDEYETHYLQIHVNRCSECARNFPTLHFLSIHIEENHDPLILARRDRGEKTFSCFVEGCDRKCSTPQKRRRHLIDKHMFPRNYNFFIVNDGVDKQTSLLRLSNNGGSRRRSQISTSSQFPSSGQEGRLRNRNTSLSLEAPRGINTAVEKNKTQGGDGQQMDVDALTSSMSALNFVPASVTRRMEEESHRKMDRG